VYRPATPPRNNSCTVNSFTGHHSLEIWNLYIVGVDSWFVNDTQEGRFYPRFQHKPIGIVVKIETQARRNTTSYS
jgi:hypothetical protein